MSTEYDKRTTLFVDSQASFIVKMTTGLTLEDWLQLSKQKSQSGKDILEGGKKKKVKMHRYINDTVLFEKL